MFQREGALCSDGRPVALAASEPLRGHGHGCAGADRAAAAGPRTRRTRGLDARAHRVGRGHIRVAAWQLSLERSDRVSHSCAHRLMYFSKL